MKRDCVDRGEVSVIKENGGDLPTTRITYVSRLDYYYDYYDYYYYTI